MATTQWGRKIDERDLNDIADDESTDSEASSSSSDNDEDSTCSNPMGVADDNLNQMGDLVTDLVQV